MSFQRKVTQEWQGGSVAERATRRQERATRYERLEHALETAGIDGDRFVDHAVSALSEVRPWIVADPATQFSSDEFEALEAGGLDMSPRRLDEADPIAETAARFAALLADSATSEEVATLLHVTRARVRQRALERTLFAIREGDEWRFPRIQFSGGAQISGLAAALPALPRDLHPVVAWRFLTEPNVDLEIVDQPVAPLAWLRSGGDPAAVAAIARDL